MQETTPVLPAPTPSESSCPHPQDSTSLVPHEPVTKRPRCASHHGVGTDVAAGDGPAVQTTSPTLPSQDSGSHNQQPPVVASDSASDTSKVKFTEGGCMMHKTRWHDSKTVRSTVSDGISYLDILASQAEKGTREVSTEIDEALEELKSFLVKKIDCKIARLKAQAQRNMAMSLTQLKSLNTATFKGRQRVFYPKERAHNLLGDTFTDIAREIFIVQGTHILDLPIAVLVHVVEYVKPRSWCMLRTVCFKFWKAVCELTRTDNITLSTAVQWEHEEWKLVGGDTVVTPTGDFEFKVVSTPEDITVWVALSVSKLFAQPKSIKIVAHDADNVLLAETKSTLTTADLLEMADTDVDLPLKGKRPVGQFHLTITVNDVFHKGRLRPSQPNKIPSGSRT